MKLHPTEMHELKEMLYYESRKKQYEHMVQKRINDIVIAHRKIVVECDAFPVYKYECEYEYNIFTYWVYDSEDLWNSIMEDGSISIHPPDSSRAYYDNDDVCGFLLFKITQDMLVSDDWQDEYRKKLQGEKE